MKNLRPFQIGLLALFGIVGVISIAILSTYTGVLGTDTNPYGEEVVIWGSFDEELMRVVFIELAREDDNFTVVRYVEHDSRTFEDDLVNAIAEGRAPDLIIMRDQDLVTYRPKLLAIPYDTLPLRTFKNTYLDGTEIFALSDGIYALPFMVDPLVMYWNRDIFANVGMAEPPTTWEALTNAVQEITLRDATRNILQSTVAFGEYRNVINAKAVLLMLMMQSGSRLIEEEAEGYEVAVDTPQVVDARRPLNATLQFFVEFSNANSPLYSWNRSQQDDLTAFVGEELALYFGLGSELPGIRDRNPNFNFDIAPVPQGAGATVRRTYGDFYGLAIVKAAPNPQGAYLAAQVLGRADVVAALSQQLRLVPVHRSSIASGTSDPFRQVMFNAALIARGWLDPDPVATNDIFQEMVEAVVSNREKVSGAVSDAVRRLELVF